MITGLASLTNPPDLPNLEMLCIELIQEIEKANKDSSTRISNLMKSIIGHKKVKARHKSLLACASRQFRIKMAMQGLNPLSDFISIIQSEHPKKIIYFVQKAFGKGDDGLFSKTPSPGYQIVRENIRSIIQEKNLPYDNIPDEKFYRLYTPVMIGLAKLPNPPHLSEIDNLCIRLVKLIDKGSKNDAQNIFELQLEILDPNNKNKSAKHETLVAFVSKQYQEKMEKEMSGPCFLQ